MPRCRQELHAVSDALDKVKEYKVPFIIVEVSVQCVGRVEGVQGATP